MENLEMEQFNPTIAELTSLADSYKWLKINGIDDEEWFLKVKEARKDLQQKRISITKFWKSLREKAIKFQKDVIEEEKKLVWIIEPIEEELQKEEDNIKRLKLIEERKYILPVRKKILEEAGIEKSDEEVLNMNDTEFELFIQSEKAIMFERLQKEANERKLKEQEEENQKQREIELERVRKETEEKTRIETEVRLKKEQEEKEMREKIEQENKEKQEKEKQEEINRNIEYNNWLMKNWYNEQEYLITTEWETKVMWKRHDTFILNLK